MSISKFFERRFLTLVLAFLAAGVPSFEGVTPQKMDFVGSALWTKAQGIEIRGTLAYVAFIDGLGILDITDTRKPVRLSQLYLGGGYPEEHAAELAANRTMLADIKAFAAALPVYAECGGLMYLAEGLQTLDGRRHALAGVLPLWTLMLPRRKALGYVEVTLTHEALGGARGAALRGHEFHYSELLGDPAGTDTNSRQFGNWLSVPAGAWRTVYSVQSRREPEPAAEGFQRGRVLASYVHVHFASRPEAVRNFVAQCGGAA
jgi:cobyrinic acid a,c-diamide synthase